jgi:hypothetical protein
MLLCKNHYKYNDFFEALKMIWAVRCGYDYTLTSKDALSYIADDLYDIIRKCQPEKLPYLMETIHKEVTNPAFCKPTMTPIEAIIWEYKSIIHRMQIKELIEEKYEPIILLPKPQGRIFNRILRGSGKHTDYYTITEADNNKTLS